MFTVTYTVTVTVAATVLIHRGVRSERNRGGACSGRPSAWPQASTHAYGPLAIADYGRRARVRGCLHHAHTHVLNIHDVDRSMQKEVVLHDHGAETKADGAVTNLRLLCIVLLCRFVPEATGKPTRSRAAATIRQELHCQTN